MRNKSLETYWPNTIYVENGKAKLQSTYEGKLSLAQAKEVIDRFEEMYKIQGNQIVCSYIRNSSGDTVWFQNYTTII